MRKPYVDAVNKMTVYEGQSQGGHRPPREVGERPLRRPDIAHRDGACPEDDPFVEHYQTPPILEIMYEADPAFKASMWKFIDAIAANKALIGREAVRLYGGMYGPTCVVDFALSVGSTSNVVNRILTGMDIPKDHKRTILACKSWGMNTSYGLAGAFRGALESGKTAAEAEQAEVDMLQFVYREPCAAQAQLMDTHNLGGHGPHTSFDTRKYMAGYKEKMRATVIAAMKGGVHYANITAVPAYCVGDVAHHIAQSAYNMFNDDMVFAIYDAVTGVLENTLDRALKARRLQGPLRRPLGRNGLDGVRDRLHPVEGQLHGADGHRPAEQALPQLCGHASGSRRGRRAAQRRLHGHPQAR